MNARRVLTAAAHAFVAAKATAAVDECMQLSGGIGFTWEYPAALRTAPGVHQQPSAGHRPVEPCAARRGVRMVSAAAIGPLRRR